jgi:hypothetical membrane protein
MENQKVLGLDASKYTNICYMLIIISSIYGVLSNLLAFVKVILPLGAVFGLMGLAGIILALIGLFAFKEKFQPLDLAHFKYMGLIFVVFFAIAVILGMVIGYAGAVAVAIVLILSVIQFALIFAGYKNYKAGIAPTQESIKTTIKSGFKA